MAVDLLNIEGLKDLEQQAPIVVAVLLARGFIEKVGPLGHFPLNHLIKFLFAGFADNSRSSGPLDTGRSWFGRCHGPP